MSACRTRILVTSRNGGIIETIPNAVSLHSIKKNAYAAKLNRPNSEYTLLDHFVYVRTLAQLAGRSGRR